ncbi:MAG: signal peptidase [Frankiaceae bacterium]|jgi:signal peptidase I|nr:signal peptidase [Frankiaceae bacterium]
MTSDAAVEERLQVLADAAAPTISAPPLLTQRAFARLRRRGRRRRLLLAGGGAIAIAGSVLGARAGHAGPYRNVVQASQSMSPTIAMNESVILDTRLSPRLGDVVLLRVHQGGATFESIKRVEALPGDTISCPAAPDGTCHQLLRNGSAVREQFLGGPAGSPFAAVSIPSGAIYVLGDNRDASADSRVWGTLPVSDVAGVVVRIVDAHGRQRVVGGAPVHPAPGGGASVDPQEPPPPAQATTPSS